MRPDIQCGDLVKDRITGFTGIVTAVEFYIHAVAKANVQPQELKDGKSVEPEVGDFEDFEILEKQKVSPVAVTYKGAIEIGDTAKDRITGYKGIVIEKRISISGCLQFAVRPKNVMKDKDGRDKVDWGVLFMASELELVSKATVAPKSKELGTGPAKHGRSSR